MALTFEDLDAVAISEVGAELATARNLINKTSSDFVLDLRTTRHHINAIEAGDLRIFYGAPFYIDLMRRYAKSLDFSENKVLLFEKRVLGFLDEKTDTPPNKSDRSSWNNSADFVNSSSMESKKNVFTNVKIKRKKLSIDPTNFKILKEKNDRLLLIIIVLTIIVAGLAFVLPKNYKSVNDLSNPIKKQASNNLKNEVPNYDYQQIQLEEENVNVKFGEDTQDGNQVENPRQSNQIGNLKIIEEIKIQDIQPPPQKSNSIDVIIGDSINESLDNDFEPPKVSLFASQKTWFWIRYSDDSIKEFMVNANTKTDILDFPIYLVIGNPEKVEMYIGGELTSIKRNDPDRNLARYTRTELRAMAK